MPSSDNITISPILKLVKVFNPSSILDVGCGDGKYGFLFREILDLNYERLKRESWKIKIDGVEIEKNYHNPIHDYFYNKIYWGDWLQTRITDDYDLVFMGDVLEHFDENNWRRALDRGMEVGTTVICVCPNWDGSINQGVFGGNEYEKHRVVLSPSMIGGKCVWANTKVFININSKYGELNIGKNVLL